MTEKSLSKPPVSSGSAQKELDKVEKQFEAFHDQVKTLTQDRLNQAPKQEADVQEQTKAAKKTNDVWLKPKRSLAPGIEPKTGKREEFNEKWRSDYEYKKEYVHFTAENKEIIGETIKLWTKAFPGVDAEEWEVPANRPVWGPRYLAERIKGCTYHRLHMEEHKAVANDAMGTYTGQIVVDHTVQRLDAHPVSDKKSIFMGASGF